MHFSRILLQSKVNPFYEFITQKHQKKSPRGVLVKKCFIGEHPWQSVDSMKMQHLCGTASGTAIWNVHCLVNPAIFFS